MDFSLTSLPSQPGANQDAPTIPSWITPELVALTIKTWQPYYKALISPEDAVTMILAVGRLYEVLSEGEVHETLRGAGSGQQS